MSKFKVLFMGTLPYYKGPDSGHLFYISCKRNKNLFWNLSVLFKQVTDIKEEYWHKTFYILIFMIFLSSLICVASSSSLSFSSSFLLWPEDEKEQEDEDENDEMSRITFLISFCTPLWKESYWNLTQPP